MAILHQLLSVEYLKELDEKELHILYTAIQHEINTSDPILDLLKRKATEVYTQLRPGITPRGPTGAEAPRRGTTPQAPTGAEASRRRPRRRR
jgi:hypothetical protein